MNISSATSYGAAPSSLLDHVRVLPQEPASLRAITLSSAAPEAASALRATLMTRLLVAAVVISILVVSAWPRPGRRRNRPGQRRVRVSPGPLYCCSLPGSTWWSLACWLGMSIATWRNCVFESTLRQLRRSAEEAERGHHRTNPMPQRSEPSTKRIGDVERRPEARRGRIEQDLMDHASGCRGRRHGAAGCRHQCACRRLAVARSQSGDLCHRAGLDVAGGLSAREESWR